MIPMPDMPTTALLDISVVVEHGQARITLAGEIDITNADDVRRCVDRHLDDPDIIRVIADLAAVTFLDSRGLRALSFSRQHAERMGKSFLIQNHHGHIARVIEIVGLSGRLT